MKKRKREKEGRREGRKERKEGERKEGERKGGSGNGQEGQHSYFTPSIHNSGYFLDKADKESLVTYTHELMCTV